MSERPRHNRSRRREIEEERLREEAERRRRIARARRRRQIRRRKMMLTAAAFLLLLVVGVSAGVMLHRKSQEKKEQEAREQQKQAEAAAKEEEENNTLHMVAVGDNLIHDAFIQAGKDNDWNFDFLYENIKDQIKDADLASVNQETPLTDNHKNAAGYPDFNTPIEVGDALVKAGFDIVTQATEHAFDQEETGIKTTVSFWEKQYPEISLLGIHDKDGQQRYEIIEEKNFKVALLNYSTMLSENHTIPDDEDYMVNTYSTKNVEADMEQAREEADVVIVYLHGGQDDSVEPDEKQKERVQFLAEQGADVVICSHPHILKGYEKVKRPDGKDMLVYYSLGNFVSDQASLENLLGGMADFTLKRDGDTGEVTIEEYSLVPLVMHYNSDYTECTVYKLDDYSETLAQEHGIHQEDEEAEFTLSALKDAAREAGEITTDWDQYAEDGEDSSDQNTDDQEDSQGNNDEDTDSGSSRSSSDEDTDAGSSRSSSDEDTDSGSSRSSSDEDTDSGSSRSSSDEDADSGSSQSSSDEDTDSGSTRTSRN